MDSQKDEQSFSLKVQESHPIYEGVCTCKENYVGETGDRPHPHPGPPKDV